MEVGFRGSPYQMGKRFSNATQKISNLNGAGQRLLIGAATIATQPFYDYFNYTVDKETRKYSTVKTVVKIIVGTGVGFIVRSAAIKASPKIVPALMKHIKDTPAYTKKGSQEFEEASNIIGTGLGVFASLFTNFLVDMPLNKWGVNKLAEKLNLKQGGKDD